MEALRLQDAAYVSARYEELQELKRQQEQRHVKVAADERAPCYAPNRELSAEQRQELEQWRIVERAAALDAQGPTPRWKKKFSVLASVLESLYAQNGADPSVTSPSKMALSRPETGDGACSPVPLKELPLPTQVALKMFFRTCQSLRDPAKLAANSRLSVQIASKLPAILTTMPPCVLSPGLVDDTSVELEDGSNVSSVFYQLFRLFEELLGVTDDEMGDTNSAGGGDRVCLSISDRATVIVAYVALALKWGRLAYLLKGVKLLLENGDELNGVRFEPLGPLFRELASASIERPQIAFGEEEQPCGYLMSFGKGDHGKLGHGQCAHVSCQEGNCTENKMVPTMIAATRDVLFRKIDSLSTHSIAITTKGKAMAWGNGDKYRLGHGSSSKEYMPRTIEFLSLKGRVRDLACGLGHTLALMECGELFAWGNGSNGRLGLGDTNDRSSPTQVVIPTVSTKSDVEGSTDPISASTTPIRFRHIFCGASHSLGISWDGRVYAWGKNNQGQCGHGHTNDQWTIHEIESFRDNEEGEEDEFVVYAAGGWEHTLFCTASGRVYSCGCGYKDSRRAGIPPVLGHGDCDRRLKPSLVQTLEDAHQEIVKVACGWDHSLAVTANGRVYTWGSGTNGKLGHGDEESFDVPTLVRSMEGNMVTDAKAGCEHTVFLTHDHELWTCGQGDSGRLGHGDNQTRKRPTKIELFTECGLKPVALAVGDKYNLVLVKDADGQYEHDGENAGTLVQNPIQSVNAGVVSGHHGRHRAVHYKKRHEMHFGAQWVLEIAAGVDPNGGPAASKNEIPPKDLFTPRSAREVALFIAGHVDRLASDYVAEATDTQGEKQNESKATRSFVKPQTVLLPFAVDTSCESLSALLQVLRWSAPRSDVESKGARSEKNGVDGSCVSAHVRMGLALACLRILQLNLEKSRGVSAQNVGEIDKFTSKRLNSPTSLFQHIHELLDTLAGLRGDAVMRSFENGPHCSGSKQSLSAIGNAISQEAASALKMGFGIFYPTGVSRSKLLWGILEDCKIDTPSMRTIILSDQLCQDSVMTEIFKCVPSYGLLDFSEALGGIHNENTPGKDVYDIKTLMITLLQRCSVEATKHLENEASTNYSNEPDCFLRLLHVLQTHYFSIVHQFAYRSNYKVDPGPASTSPSQRILASLLEYVDALMTEALAVLKRLHKASRQHEDIITWRLNGSFFHTLLPSALECLSVLLLPDTKPENRSENLLLVERVLPNLHVMLQMLDEVSWKMHNAGDGGNQTYDCSTSPPLHSLVYKNQEHNWFVDLGVACAILCGKLSCELLYPPSNDNVNHGMYCDTLLTEGNFLDERQNVVDSIDIPSSVSITRILEWERLSVFEVEDELVNSKDEPSPSGSAGTMSPTNLNEDRRFLLQLNEMDFSTMPISLWNLIASSLSHNTEFTAEIQQLLTLVASVLAWHLGMVDELRQAYELYDTLSRKSPHSEVAFLTPTGNIWEVFTACIVAATTKDVPWTCSRAGSNTNAIKLSRLLLSLQPNSVLVGCKRGFEGDREDKRQFGACIHDSVEDLFKILITVDADAIERSFRRKEVHHALVRTGLCILHDLLRKLTTSSAKSSLLNEFVAVTSASSCVTSTKYTRGIELHRYLGKHVNKAVENLFVRLARIISSDDVSLELRKKALLAWTVPLHTNNRNIQNVVALIAKSGIMSTLVELLLDDANVLETHFELNATQFENRAGATTEGDKPGGHTVEAELLPTKGNPIHVLLFDHTPAQIISMLSWEAFCAITWQLSKSEHFAQHRSNLFLRMAGSSLQDKDLLTPRSASMSPRRRLTLPKKMVVSTIDEIIEQLIDGLFLMLRRVKDHFEAMDFYSVEYEKLLRSSAGSHECTGSSSLQQNYDARVFLFGRPIQLSHSSTQDVRISKTTQIGVDSDSTFGITISFWIFVEHTGAIVTKHSTETSHDGGISSTTSRSKESIVRLLALSSDPVASTEADQSGSDKHASLIVFSRDAYPDHISVGISIRCAENSNDDWSTILIDQHIQRGNWINVVLGFGCDKQDQFRVCIGGKLSTVNNGKCSIDNCKLICPEFFQKAVSWTVLTTGGNVHIQGLDQGCETGNDTLDHPLQPLLPKKTYHVGFAAFLDDVIITREPLSDEMAVRMQTSGTILFRLKQQHLAEHHCMKVLQLLCQLVGENERNVDQSSLAPLSFSDRWITLFVRMLVSTCRGQDLAQAYLCYLLQDIMPRAPPLPELDIQAMCQTLLDTRINNTKPASVEDLFTVFNGQSLLPSTSVSRQNETLYRLMQQRNILHGRSLEKGTSGSNCPSSTLSSGMVPFKTNTSMRFAAAVYLLQKMSSTPSWKSRMDEYIVSSTNMFRLDDKNSLHFSDVHAVVNIVAGYSEEVLNVHRVSTHDGASFPAPLQAASLPFSSVIQLEDTSFDQSTAIQKIMITMLKGETQQALSLAARNDILTKYHNDIMAVNAADRRIAALVHLRARILRVLMTALLREHKSTTKTWHHFLLDNAAVCEDLLGVASSCAKDFVTTTLGPNAKVAMKLRRLRLFSKGSLRGGKHRRIVHSAVSIADLESLQWRIWEEMRLYPGLSTSFTLWWQQSKDDNGKLTIEVVGGNVELSDLKVTALEHFPTVKLSQANISANSGLWFFEVTVVTDGLMQIGYVDGDFTADPLQGEGVGDHTNSWAFDGFRCKKWNVNSYDYGEQWKTDDVVGVLLDTDRMEISYFLNGKFLGVAFSGVSITANSRMCPAASLNVHQSAQFNFGTAASANEGGLQSPTFDGFKHLPALNNDDQARLRPVVYAIQNHRPLKSDGISIVGSQDKNVSNVNDMEDDWASSSSDSATDDGEIAIEGSERHPGLRPPVEGSSRDGREARTTDTNDDDNGQRCRDLVEGLTGLGFPLEWATRCATETRLPMDETGAVAWILEQMEKVGLDGSSTLTSVSAGGGDGIDYPGQGAALWSTQAHLPNTVVSNSDDDLAAQSALLSGSGESNVADKLDGGDVKLSSEIGENQLPFVSAINSLTERPITTPAEVNPFIEVDKDDRQSDDETTEAFQAGPYKQRQTIQADFRLLGKNYVTPTTNETQNLDSKRGVDDLLPLSITVDTTVFIAYARQTFTSLLLLALHENEQAAVYAMVRQFVSSNESSAKFHRVLRMTVGLDPMDATFDLGFVSDTTYSEQSLQLQKALAVLLQCEAQNSVIKQLELPPLLKSLSQEMVSQCDRALSLAKSNTTSKIAMDSVAVQSAAAWFGWVSGLVLTFVETHELGQSSSNAEMNSVFAAPAVFSTVFVENLVGIASSPSSTADSWKYAVFRLLPRILLAIRSYDSDNPRLLPSSRDGLKQAVAPPNTELKPFASAQLANLAELFTLRRRREMYDRVFFSDVTSCLFMLLVRSSCSFVPKFSLEKQQQLKKPNVGLVVTNYSSRHVTISWDFTQTALLAVRSADIVSETASEMRTEINSLIFLLEVKRWGPQPTGCSFLDDVDTSSPKALPSKGTYTIRSLLPDTMYQIRMTPAQSLSTDNTMPQAAPMDGAEVIVQTTPAPVFDLDKDTTGKNLVIFNRNLSAKNTVNKKWHSVRASVAFDEGVHQWQVRLDTCVSKNVFIGVCTAEASMENYIGSDAYGYGFLANKAVWHNKAKLHSYGEIFKQGDIIQVTLDCNAKTLAFSRNGEYLGIAASNMRAGIGRSGVSSNDPNCKWYPAFSMYNKDDKLTLIPPSATSVFSSKSGRPQNASTFELIEAMHGVLAYQTQLTTTKSDRSPATSKLFEKAYEAFEDWRCSNEILREVALGQVIAIDKRKSATDKYGLAAGDSVFTSKGQCTVLGEYRHELWYEVDEGGSSSLFDATTTQLACWSLSACREMLASPDEYPVHRHHKYKLELESNTITETQTNMDPVLEQETWATQTTEGGGFSYQEFVEAQEQWSESATSAADLDAKLIAELDAIASQASSNSLLLSFADVSTTLLLEKIYDAHGISAEHGANQTLARIGLLLYVNRCLYNVARLAIPRNTYTTSLQPSCNSESISNERDSSQSLSPSTNTECYQVSPVAALLSSPHWGLGDSSDFSFVTTLAARLLFASLKEKLIGEELRSTRTTSRASDNLQELRDNEEGGVDNDLPVVKISYRLPPPIPFWQCSMDSKQPPCLRLPAFSERSIFVQLATQLAAQDACQWRRESSQPFEAIPISQTFRVQIEKSFNLPGETSKDVEHKSWSQQQSDEDDDEQLQQPSSKQTTKYLQLFESVAREVQSPNFPLFRPVESSQKVERPRVGALTGDLRSTLQLDINLELFSPPALAHSQMRIPQLLLWYFGFGQCLGIAWRSKILLPLQFLSSAFWKELATPAEPVTVIGGSDNRTAARSAAIRAIRDGLFSIIPSRCVSLLSGNNPSLRERLSDLDVNYVVRLERHAVYPGLRQDRHDIFWKVVNTFTSLERRMLEQFVNPDRRNYMKQLEVTAGTPPVFALEIADALADGRDHPDSCYPVVVQISPHSSRLHLPAYSSAQTLRHKLLLAMTNIPFM